MLTAYENSDTSGLTETFMLSGVYVHSENEVCLLKQWRVG